MMHQSNNDLIEVVNYSEQTVSWYDPEGQLICTVPYDESTLSVGTSTIWPDIDPSDIEEVTVREVRADFEDYPCNKDEPEGFMSVTEWGNGEGFHASIQGPHGIESFDLTYTRFHTLHRLVNKLFNSQ